jgi:hypothetical protein
MGSSREARTSMSANMRSITWMVGVGGAAPSVFFMGKPWSLPYFIL